MKKTTVIISAALIIVLAGAGILYALLSSSTPSASATATATISPSAAETTAPLDQIKPLENIPVYRDNELLFANTHYLRLGVDASVYYMFSSLPNNIAYLQESFPNIAIRTRDENTKYLVYDTDTGYRLFLYNPSHINYKSIEGFPIVVKELLPYSDFAELHIGDAMEKVEAVDPVASIYKKHMIETFHMNDPKIAEKKDLDLPRSSIHYLKDGILKIDYKTTEERKLIIANMTFNSDYLLPLASGIEPGLCYKICDIDLP